MRSVSFTLLLIVLATAATLVAALRLKEGSLESLLGSPPVEVGKYLYKFDPQQSQRLALGGNGVRADCTHIGHGVWHVEARRGEELIWQDRMDPRVATLIVEFTLGARVVDRGRIDDDKAGFKEGTIGVLIADKDKNPLANYMLGRTTKWVDIDPKTSAVNSTVFIKPLDPGRSDDSYAATGDIHSLFRDGFRHLRDHHPFLLNPILLESIRIQEGEEGLLLSHADPKSPWRITKPMELKTNPEAIKKLLNDLLQLRAIHVTERSAVTLPPENAKGRKLIALRHFGEEKETVLEIMPPTTPEAENVYATVSDRPGTVFELPLKPMATVPVEGQPAAPRKGDLISLAEIPDTINELRDSTLVTLNEKELQRVLIASSTGPEIVVEKERGGDWFYGRPGGKMEVADPLTLLRLYTAITKYKVLEFASDAATNLAPFGLDRPAITLHLVSFGGELLEFRFGQSTNGTWYAMRAGTSTVMRVDESLIADISTQPWQWRPSTLWSSIDAVDVLGISRSISGKPKLELIPKVLEGIWLAREGGKDRSSELVTARAERFLEVLLRFRGESWLSPQDADAAVALVSPTLTIEITATKIDQATGQPAGVVQHTLVLAPAAPGQLQGVYYGRLDNDPFPFRVSAAVVEPLLVDFFGND